MLLFFQYFTAILSFSSEIEWFSFRHRVPLRTWPSSQHAFPATMGPTPAFASTALVFPTSRPSLSKCRRPSSTVSVRRVATAQVESPGGGGGLPAGVLLGASSILAIASVGCLFELGSGHPQYGTGLTAGILAGAGPGFVVLFAQAIKKGRAEAEED